MTDFLTTKDVAELLGIAPRTVRLWAECGELPGIKLGRQWRFRKNKLNALLEKAVPLALAAYSHKKDELKSALGLVEKRRQI